jgi:hypothetical protein
MSGMQYAGMMGAIAVFMDQMVMTKEFQEKEKQRIHDEWQKTFDMPRKMKKQRRKELQLDWAIANYDPFENFLGD